MTDDVELFAMGGWVASLYVPVGKDPKLTLARPRGTIIQQDEETWDGILGWRRTVDGVIELDQGRRKAPRRAIALIQKLMDYPPDWLTVKVMRQSEP